MSPIFFWGERYFSSRKIFSTTLILASHSRGRQGATTDRVGLVGSVVLHTPPNSLACSKVYQCKLEPKSKEIRLQLEKTKAKEKEAIELDKKTYKDVFEKTSKKG